MGCDIHDVLQVNKNGKWDTIAFDMFNNRNYSLFALLADVRNGESSPIKPISEQKGLPSDFEIDDEYHGRHWMGEHSFSFYTLAELKRWLTENTEIKITMKVFVPFTEYVRCKQENDTPCYLCGGVGGEEIIILTEQQAEDALNGKYALNHVKNYFVDYTFEINLIDAVGIKILIEEIEKIVGTEVAPENVRYVFGFDN